MSVQEVILKLASEGLGSCTLEQLEPLAAELGLAGVAEKAARKVLPANATEELAAIRMNAPLRAFDQAIRNFVPTGKAYALSSYLKRYTWFWAKRYADDVLKGKPVPTVTLPTGATSLAEVPTTEDVSAVSTEQYALPSVQRVLETLGIRYKQTGRRELSFRLCCGGVEMQFFANVVPEAVVFFGYVPVLVPIYRRAAVAEALPASTGSFCSAISRWISRTVRSAFAVSSHPVAMSWTWRLAGSHCLRCGRKRRHFRRYSSNSP